MEIQLRPATLLRYRFSNLEQARAHLHDQRLFFYRDDKVRLLPSAPVCLQLHFYDATSPRILHGSVHGSLEGSGTWIQLLDARPILAQAEYPRASPRLGCDLPVELRFEGGVERCRLLDLGMDGARILGVPSLPAEQAVELRLLSSDRLTFRDLSFARVVWTDGSQLGVQFELKDAIGRSAVARLLAELEAQWRRAWDALHPPSCCQPGALAPEPPRIPRGEGGASEIAL